MGQQYSREEILSELRGLDERLDDTPTADDVDEYCSFSYTTCYNHFESFSEAKRLAGIEVLARKNVTGEEYLEELQRVREQIGRVPRAKDMSEHSKFSVQPYQSRWGTWTGAIEAAGMEPVRQHTVTDEELLDDLSKLADELGRTPTSTDVDDHGQYSVSSYTDRFGSIKSARDQAGLDREVDLTDRVEFTCDWCGETTEMIPSSAERRDYCSSTCANRARHGITNSELLEALESVAEDLGRAPRASEFDERTEYWHVSLGCRFGSYSEAVRKLGYEPAAPKDLDEEDLIEEIHRLNELVDGVPLTKDVKESGRWSVFPFSETFGSWADALREAGLEPLPKQHTNVSRDELIEEMKRVGEEIGAAPSYTDIRERAKYSANTYERVFGSFLSAKEAAGFEPKPSYHNNKEHTTSELISELERVADLVNGVPSATDIRDKSVYSVSAFSYRFGSWREALREVGFDPEPIRVPDERLLEEIRQLADEKGRPPTQSEVQGEGEYSVSVYYDRWGSWLAAKQKAGLDDTIRQPSRRVSKETALEALRELTDELGRAPSHDENIAMGVFSTALYKRKFESWSDAKEAAGLDPTPVTANIPSGEEHYGWKGGSQPYYGPNWTENRQKALERDNFECQHCGMTDEQHIDEYGHSLHVHHITPAREFDDHEARNDLSNLITLCTTHHKRWEGTYLRPQRPEE